MEFWDHLFLFKRLYDQTMDPIAQRWDLTRMELDILLFLANAPAYDTAADIVERRRLTKSKETAYGSTTSAQCSI